MPRTKKTTENTEDTEVKEAPAKKRGRPRKMPDPEKSNRRPITEQHKAKEKRERAEILKDIDEMITIGRFPEWHSRFSDPNKKVEIDQEQFEKLCSIFCTSDEIAGWFYCDLAEIHKWCHKTYGCTFGEIYEKLSMRGHISLRRIVLHHAARNPVMSIFLAKNYLGMRDNPDDESQKENIRLLMEIRDAMQETAKKPVIDTESGMVYDADYAESHASDTDPVGKPVEVDEDGD